MPVVVVVIALEEIERSDCTPRMIWKGIRNMRAKKKNGHFGLQSAVFSGDEVGVCGVKWFGVGRNVLEMN